MDQPNDPCHEARYGSCAQEDRPDCQKCSDTGVIGPLSAPYCDCNIGCYIRRVENEGDCPRCGEALSADSQGSFRQVCSHCCWSFEEHGIPDLP